MEKNLLKRNIISTSSQKPVKKQVIDDIILNYGVEIEAVFELLNAYTAYNQFINFYLHFKKTIPSFRRPDNVINHSITLFIEILIICINKHEYNEDMRSIITSLKSNEIFKSLTLKQTPEMIAAKLEKDAKRSVSIKRRRRFSSSDDDDETEQQDIIKEEPENQYDNEAITKFLNENLKLLIKESERINDTDTSISETIILFIKKWQEFLNIAITIIKYSYQDLTKEHIDLIETILNIQEDNKSNNVFVIFQKIFDLDINQQIKIYDISPIDTFFEKIQIDNEINLFLISDASVICNNNIIYKNIKSGQIVKYNYLLNNCEFITQPFKTIDDVKNKLSIFLTNPIIENTLLNCTKTSQHVHISFNNSSGIIRPDIYLILCILYVSLYFQDEIFKLFLITRTDNTYCKKLNYNILSNQDIYILTDTDYNDCLFKMCSIFNENPSQVVSINAYEHDNRYYWLNILNLFKFSIDKPYTIEFRLKHGSTDAEELGYVCKLYENIITYAKELLTDESLNIKSYTNIKEIKILIDEKIRDGGNEIFKQKILKDIDYYFTNINSDYVKGLNTLNLKLQPEIPSNHIRELYGGKHQPYNEIQHKNINIITKLITSLNTKPIYKLNSFGYEYIGHGLHSNIKNKLQITFKSKNTIITYTDLKQYLNLHNIYYNI